MSVPAFDPSPSTTTSTRQNLNRRGAGGSTSFKISSEGSEGLHDLQDNNDDNDPNKDHRPAATTDHRSKSNNHHGNKKRRAIRKRFVGFLTTFSIFVLWCRYYSADLLSSSQHKAFFPEDTEDAQDWTYDSDKTMLPPRTFPSDERFLIMEYSPWLGFNNMR